MRTITTIALLSLFIEFHACHAKPMASNQTYEAEGKMDKMLVDRLRNVLLQMKPHKLLDLDEATLAKPGLSATPQHTNLRSSLRTHSRKVAFLPHPSIGYVHPMPGCRAQLRPKAVMSESIVQAPSSDAPRTVKFISDLEKGDFQHPMDKQAGNVLQLFAPFEWGLRQAISMAEDAVFLENIASGVLVGPQQLPELHSMLLESCRILGLSPVPDLYIRQSPSPNAYTLAVQGRRPFIVVTTALLDLMDPIEIQAVIAHELGHLKCEHSLFIAMANILLTPLASVFPVGNAALESSLLQWQRTAELTCDRAALLVVQDVRAVQSVIMKLCGGGKSYAQQMDVDAFVKQATAYDEVAYGTQVGRFMRQSQMREATHPLPIMRARELERFAGSSQYKSLLDRGKPTTFQYRPSLSSNSTYVR
jgi:Zn-dependent protease with chaperone function